MKKILSLILALLMMALPMTFLSGCDDDRDDDDEDYEESATVRSSDFVSSSGGTTSKRPSWGESTAPSFEFSTYPSAEETTQPPVVEPVEPSVGEVYTAYKNLCRIDAFYNGLASFVIKGGGSSWHGGIGGSWGGDYYFGYIDINGNVVVDPIYECSPNVPLPTFEFGCVCIQDLDDHYYLLDKQGNVKFQTGENDVTRIGYVSEGYFWVERVKEELSGNVYSVEYYRSKDLKSVVKFDGARAFQENITYAPEESSFAEDGSAMLIRGNDFNYYDSDIIYLNIKDYDAEYVPQTAWTVDLKKIPAFEGAGLIYDCISENDNTKGRLAALALCSPDRVWFYAVIDSAGNVLMAPQKNIIFPEIERGYGFEDRFVNYIYRFDLCPAQDAATQKWGYIDPNGVWVIQPQYDSATPFSKDGYATVNQLTVIDTDGKVVLEKPKNNS